ncbi:chloroplast envelope membrane protein [Salvia miltiorrhiza]|uniref:chloroplast envelope membrane protein n=1 Tax=Salvia miltiorrhiza TaxID=226208 RepID=UPI0025AD7748|nr:chloroplast envelope membrane protein [Salvia miltiorrhiza]
MFLMSTSIVLCQNLILSKNSCVFESSFRWGNAWSSGVQLSRRRSCGLVPNAKKRHAKKRSWWQKFFFDEDGNWLGLKDEDAFEVLEEEEEEPSDVGLSANEKFEAWRRRAEAIVELREAQEDVKNEENRRWEDWIVDGTYDVDVSNGASWVQDSNGAVGKPGDDVEEDFREVFSGRGLAKSVRDLVLGREDDDILYEDRVFRYASFNSAKFLAVLVIVPWAVDFVVHDYILMPFLDRYVEKVPLAAQVLDVRRNQKLEMVKALKLEKARYRLEVEIGKSPPLSDQELYLELRHKALELRDEWRLENRKAFANIWSDMLFGISVFVLLYFNQNQVALLKFTGYKLLNNISDTGKAFLIILITDIFLGYHSESGWQTLLEVLTEHFGLEVDPAAITIFVCLIPVILDACVKLWMFKFLPRLSPKVANIFQEMKRH